MAYASEFLRSNRDSSCLTTHRIMYLRYPPALGSGRLCMLTRRGRQGSSHTNVPTMLSLQPLQSDGELVAGASEATHETQEAAVATVRAPSRASKAALFQLSALAGAASTSAPHLHSLWFRGIRILASCPGNSKFCYPNDHVESSRNTIGSRRLQESGSDKW